MLYGIVAALLFGVSAPLAKLLLEGIDPFILAGLLYLGAGGAMGLMLASGKLCKVESEAQIEKRDIPWLVGATLTGGVLGPILLLFGLRLTHAATASLLLNLEVVATGLVAFSFFRESVGRRAWIAILGVAAGGALLSLDLSRGLGISPGALLVIGACFAWGFDNNLTGKISLKDPRRIVMVKGIAAGSFSFLLGVVLGRPLPSSIQVLYALALGAVSYGASISFFVRSLRGVGAARTGVLFGLAPFAGVGLSLLIFRQLPTWPFFAALGLMALATLVLARERHEHPHTHTGTTHIHPHRHDDAHHEHQHAGNVDETVLHVHEHDHEEITHSHDHRPDPHHRHRHAEESSISPEGDPVDRRASKACDVGWQAVWGLNGALPPELGGGTNDAKRIPTAPRAANCDCSLGTAWSDCGLGCSGSADRCRLEDVSSLFRDTRIRRAVRCRRNDSWMHRNTD